MNGKGRSLGSRMKGYEQVYNYKFIPRCPLIARIDGRSFSKLTKALKFDKPYDVTFSSWINKTAIAIAKEVQGSVIGYTQSDEISILIRTDLAPDGSTWFDNRLQKMCSVIGSIAAANFNKFLMQARGIESPIASFDTRVFQVPDLNEALNNFIWRQQDCIRNSVIGTCYYELIKAGQGRKTSQKMMHGLNQEKMKALLKEKTNLSWEDMAEEFKYGVVIIRELKNIETEHGEAIRSAWNPLVAPKFDSQEGKEWFWQIANAKRKRDGQEKKEEV